MFAQTIFQQIGNKHSYKLFVYCKHFQILIIPLCSSMHRMYRKGESRCSPPSIAEAELALLNEITSQRSLLLARLHCMNVLGA